MIGKMKVLLLWFGMMFGAGILQAQVCYVSVTGNDEADGKDWTTAKATVKAALAVGATNIRVMIGTYAITEELRIPAGTEVHGGYTGTDLEQVRDRASQTILEGNQDCRIARVAGVLDGFTVTKGQIIQGNGGGVYVESGGKVENCIIRECEAVTAVTVGMFLCKDGSFISADDLTGEFWTKVRGCVFYVNPDLNAEEGNRGLIFSIKELLRGDWRNGLTSGDYYPDMQSAVEDMEGIAHTRKLQAAGSGSFASLAADYESIPGGDKGQWFCASIGQMLHIRNNFWTIYQAMETFQNRVPEDKKSEVFGSVGKHWFLGSATKISSTTEFDAERHWRLAFKSNYNVENVKIESDYFLMISPF